MIISKCEPVTLPEIYTDQQARFDKCQTKFDVGAVYLAMHVQVFPADSEVDLVLPELIWYNIARIQTQHLIAIIIILC